MNIIELLDSAIRMLDCGTGAGGFKEGNTCAGGGKGGSGGIAEQARKEVSQSTYNEDNPPKGEHGPLWDSVKGKNPEIQARIKEADNFWRENLPKTDGLIEKMDKIIGKLPAEKRNAVAGSVKTATDKLAKALYHGYELWTTGYGNKQEHTGRLKSAVDNFKSIMDSISK